MTEIEEFNRMIDQLRRMRESCEPKNPANKRYHSYSAAISNLKWLVDDYLAEAAR